MISWEIKNTATLCFFYYEQLIYKQLAERYQQKLPYKRRRDEGQPTVAAIDPSRRRNQI